MRCFEYLFANSRRRGLSSSREEVRVEIYFTVGTYILSYTTLVDAYGFADMYFAIFIELFRLPEDLACISDLNLLEE